MLDRKSINIKHLILGILLNILVIIAFLLIYHAYIVSPRLRSGNVVGSQLIEESSIPATTPAN